jgi:hypothetical protein
LIGGSGKVDTGILLAFPGKPRRIQRQFIKE